MVSQFILFQTLRTTSAKSLSLLPRFYMWRAGLSPGRRVICFFYFLFAVDTVAGYTFYTKMKPSP